MNELLPKERIQPSLLKRLEDDEPRKEKESRNKRILSFDKFRKSVLKDLEWLLNSRADRFLRPDGSNQLDEYPEVAKSVLNFGIPDLCGQTVSGVSVTDVERRIRQAILNYESRIVPGSLRVRVDTRPEAMESNAVTFEITGELWALPAPDPLYYRTEVDLETGRFEIRDRAHG